MSGPPLPRVPAPVTARVTRYRLLDLLRAGAALWVVVFHHQFSAPLQAAAPGVHRFLKRGDFGVPMFFVISGYCIAAAADGAGRRGQTSGHFLGRRLLRIFPPFWASLAVVAAAPALLAWLDPGAMPPPGPLETAGWAEWLRVATLTQGYGLEVTRGFAQPYAKFSGVYWTLGVEVQFYLVAAVALRLGEAGDRFLAAVSLASVPFLIRQDLWLEGLFLPFWPQFAVGLLAYRLTRSGRTSAAVLGVRPARVLFPLGLVGVLAATVSDPLARFNFGFERAVFAAAFAVVLWLGTSWEPLIAAWEARSPGWRGAPLRAAFGLGAISYSLYLLHGTLLDLGAALARRVTSPDSAAADGLVLVGVVGACVPFYYCFERPVLGWRSAPRRGAPEGIGK